MDFVPGLVSVSFRPLSPERIVSLCRENGLSAVEWGGDIHAAPEQPEAVAAVKRLSDAAGIAVPEYGSYYTLGEGDAAKMQRITESAALLGTDVIRVWAGKKTGAEMSADTYRDIVEETQTLCDRYPSFNFCLECHNWTLTAEYHDALAFLSDVGRKNCNMFWQPNHFLSHAYNREALSALLPYVYSVHVFSWEGKDGNTEPYPLARHADRWAEYLDILKGSPRDRMYLMLEFMHDNDPASLPGTAKTLFRWIEAAEKG